MTAVILEAVPAGLRELADGQRQPARAGHASMTALRVPLVVCCSLGSLIKREAEAITISRMPVSRALRPD